MDRHWKRSLPKAAASCSLAGAGVSTESGIPDFRSVDGLYHQKYAYPPETILSHTFWEENPGGVLPFLPR